MTQYEKKTAYEKGGYRERYAMINGQDRVVYNGNRRLIVFEYDLHNPYQDANGATYDATNECWVD